MTQSVDELLQALSAKIHSGEVSRDEVLSRLNITAPSDIRQTTEKTKKASVFSVTKMLYVLGAAIVIIGISIFITQIWNDIETIGRIAVTFGLGLLLAAIGTLLLKDKEREELGGTFHAMGGVLIPFGAMVTLTELDSDTLWGVALTFLGITIFYTAINAIQRHAILTFFTIANATAAVYLVVRAIIGESNSAGLDIESIYQYLTLLVGVSYLMLAYAFRGSWNKHLNSALHFFGITAFLGAAFSIMLDSLVWQIVYFLLVLGGLFLSVHMKSRSVLVMSTLFLLGHVSYITGEYFADSLGWPISLALLGFVFIGLGYASVAINKKYIKHSN